MCYDLEVIMPAEELELVWNDSKACFDDST